MAWTVPEYSRNQVNRAGDVLVQGGVDAGARDDALEILNNWRASHSFPLNTFQVYLRRQAKRVYQHAVVAQRLKRTPSTIAKLRRFPTMRLARMQDIGGCRAVVRDVRQVRQLRQIYEQSRIKHTLVGEKDYISSPKSSGYRGVHLIYRYRSDRNQTYNGLQIEIQLRSRLQHSWATAVETVGTFLEQSLKSSEGPDAWLDFFKLTGSAFASLEGTEIVPGTPEGAALRDAVADFAERLDVQRRLSAYGMALQTLDESEMATARYFLLVLNPVQRSLTVSGFSRRELEDATEQYLATEREMAAIPGAEVVLVAGESLVTLRRAYPNYFLDTQVFLRTLARVLAV